MRPVHRAAPLRLLALAAATFAAAPLAAQERPAASPPPTDADDLAQRVVDPTQPLTAVNLRSIWIPSVNGSDATGTSQQFQPVIPLKAFGHAHILRTTVSFASSGARGLSDVTLFDLVVLPRSWGRLGIGPLVQMLPRAGGSELRAGAAIGGTAKRGKWTIGAFNQNVFSRDAQATQLQPVIAYQLGGGYALGAGDMQLTYDWKRSSFVNVPIGLGLTKVTLLAKQPIKLQLNPEWNLRSLAGTPRFTVRFGFGVLAPGG